MAQTINTIAALALAAALGGLIAGCGATPSESNAPPDDQNQPPVEDAGTPPGDASSDALGTDAAQPDVVEDREDGDDVEPPAPCDADPQCGDGQICDAGQCVPGCRGDAQCDDGQICQSFVCTPGCRNPSDCPTGQICQNLTCVPEPCSADSDCGQGSKCVEAVCEEVGDAPCQQDDECGWRWQCSPNAGVCHEGQCLVHDDCGSDQWCRQGVCQLRRDSLGKFTVSAYQPTGMSVHEVAARRSFHESYGTTGALFEREGDGRLDLFLGSFDPETDSAPCIYRNRSEPGRVVFEPVSRFCGWEAMGDYYAASGVDIDEDGSDELFLLGLGKVRMVRTRPRTAVTDLMDLFEPDDEAHLCPAHAVLGIDLNYDGLKDLIIGCFSQNFSDAVPENTWLRNLILMQQSDGSFVPGQFGLDGVGATLALGARDVNGDGLLDILVANDTFTSRDEEANGLDPGGVYMRCSPLEECDTRPARWGNGDQGWGSYMGMGSVVIDGQGEHLYVADLGPNRMVRFEDGFRPIDIAPEMDVELDSRDGFRLFSWGVVVDDFDLNGLDDILVTNGSFGRDQSGPVHFDSFFLQRQGRGLEEITQGLGLPVEGEPISTRATVKADLDLDGRMDLISMVGDGAPRFMALEADPQEPLRCTLRPRSFYVPTHGFGHSIAPEGTDQWRHWDLQGQTRMSTSSHILSPWQRGRLRFASGAVVAYDCGQTPGPVDLVEPQWLTVEANEEGVFVVVDGSVLEREPQTIQVALRGAQLPSTQVDAVAQEPGRWRIAVLEGSAEAMVRVDGRWVARWLALP